MPSGLKDLPKLTLARRVRQLGQQIVVSVVARQVRRRSSLNSDPNQVSTRWNGDPNEPCSSWETAPNQPPSATETDFEPLLDIWSELNFDLSELFNGLSFNWDDIGAFALSEFTLSSHLTHFQIAMTDPWLAGTCFSRGT